MAYRRNWRNWRRRFRLLAETDRLAAARVEQAQAVDEVLARARAAAEDPADRSSRLALQPRNRDMC
jgi:hypothetical protein